MTNNEFYVELCKAISIGLGTPFGYDAPSYEEIIEHIKKQRETSDKCHELEIQLDNLRNELTQKNTEIALLHKAREIDKIYIELIT